MHTLITLVAAVFGLAGLVGMLISLIALITLTGYFLLRVLLKVLGLHSGSAAQVSNELKAIVMCGVLVLFTIVCLVAMELIGYSVGAIS